MSLFLATLLVGLVLLLLGGALAADTTLIRSALKAFPRSAPAAYVLFGGAALWFLTRVSVLSEADFGQYRNQLLVGFAVVAVLSFFYVGEFLAVRGLAALILLAAGPLLASAYGEYAIPARLFMVSAVYLALTAALVLGAQPYRLRDAIDWLQRVPGRARWNGAALAAYGLLLVGVAFTY
ncbi:MAG: hypothetical protein NTU80_09270 [Verrucomicrobia bacterium]|nr:hypothetical protein [Verrucomicrobiota bacterium]